MTEEVEDDESGSIPTDDKNKHRSSKKNLPSTIADSPVFAEFNKGLRALSTIGRAVGFDVSGVTGLADNLSEITKFAQNFGTQTKKTIESLSDFKKRHGDTPNREENLNPLGILSNVKNLVDELKKLGEAVEGLLEKAESLGANIDAARKGVHDALSLIESAKEALDDWKTPEDTSESQREVARKISLLQSWPESNCVVSGKGDSSTAEQLDELRKFVASLVNAIETNDLSDVLGTALRFLKKFGDDSSELLSNFTDALSGLTEALDSLSPKSGPFSKNGTRQNFDPTKKKYRSVDSTSSSLEASRPSYADKSHSSVSKLATDFGNKGQSERDVVEKANAAVRNMDVASRGIGEGDKVQRDPNTETLPIQNADDGPVGPLDSQRWKTYKQKLAQRESGDDYKKQNTIGFSGKWQFGGPALVDLGYVKPGTTTRSLKTDAKVWTGKDGVDNKEDFLANKNNCQDKALLDFTRRNYKSLLRMKIVDEGTSPDKVAGYLATAHLLGPGGARNLKNGGDGADAYGTKASSYYNMMSGAVAGGVPQNEASTSVAQNGGDEASQRSAFVGSTTVPDSKRVSFPKSDSAAVRYPYNKPRVYESGHFKEYDNTPGRERIQERHRTGTGYEIDQDGTMKTTIMRDGWRAVIGSDYLMVQGSCNIMAKGDITLSAGGTLNVNCQEYNLVVAGSKRETVEGTSYERVAGSKNSMVLGNEAKQVDGFMKTGVAGDVQLDGASMNLIARDGDLNAAATNNANLYGLSKANVVGKGKATVSSKGDVAVSSGGQASVSAGSIGMSADGSFGVKSGSASIDSGSVIQVTPKVSHAKHSELADVAAILGAVVRPANQSYSPSAKGEHDARQSEFAKQDFDKNFKSFDPVDTSKNQGHGNGQESSKWDGRGYQKGVNSKIET